MANHVPAPPTNTWLGKLIIGYRACRGLLTKPSPLIAFTVAGDVLTGKRSAVFNATPANILKAIFSECIWFPPHRSIEDVRAGETVTFYQDMTAGRGLYWSKIQVRIGEVDASKFLEFQLVSIDDDVSERLQAIGNEYRFESVPGGTRFTSIVIDKKGGDAEMFRSYMSFAITSEFERIARNLKGPGGAQKLGSPNPPRTPPARKSAVQRA